MNGKFSAARLAALCPSRLPIARARRTRPAHGESPTKERAEFLLVTSTKETLKSFGGRSGRRREREPASAYEEWLLAGVRDGRACSIQSAR